LDDKARYYALKLLGYRGRSVKELEERLRKKGFPTSVVTSTVRNLKQVGLLDDKALAESLRREAIKTKLLSQYGARHLMLKRGIPKEIVDSLFTFDEREDIETAGKLIHRKLRAMEHTSPEKRKRRLYHFLLRRGYCFDTIKRVLKEKRINEED